tara:strand:+ start:652 stop:960 length:309 start_codon:yes stop_codon:yes gene_type:complete
MKFVPKSWNPRPKDIKWACDEFRINADEVKRQIELMRDHEFRRSYTDWNRVFRNWMRKADQINTLNKEHLYQQPLEMSKEERQAEDVKAWRRLNELRQMRGG